MGASEYPIERSAYRKEKNNNKEQRPIYQRNQNSGPRRITRNQRIG